MRHRRFITLLLVLVLLGVGAGVVAHLRAGPSLTPLRARIVALAQGQVGYRTDPSDSYCNKFSAFWAAGVDDCGNNGNLDEEWCADFAAWAWKEAGAEVAYRLAPGYLNSDSASFYVWGTDHGTWHPVGSHYAPQPGDVAVVIAGTGDGAAPDVVNGDGDRTGYSVVEVGDRQAFADVKGKGAPLSGYVSPSSPSPAPSSS